jgi:hypothetical protein
LLSFLITGYRRRVDIRGLPYVLIGFVRLLAANVIVCAIDSLNTPAHFARHR